MFINFGYQYEVQNKIEPFSAILKKHVKHRITDNYKLDIIVRADYYLSV